MDESIARYAREHDRLILTQDDDFFTELDGEDTTGVFFSLVWGRASIAECRHTTRYCAGNRGSFTGPSTNPERSTTACTRKLLVAGTARHRR